MNRRLSKISANENVFNEAIPPYQNALNNSGYNYVMKYEPEKETNTPPKNRKRRILWYNPPWSANCSTKIGAKFLNLVDTCFPPTNPLHKIFNRNTLKVSYSCMPNMAQVISKHNLKGKGKTKSGFPLGATAKGGWQPAPWMALVFRKGLYMEPK